MAMGNASTAITAPSFATFAASSFSSPNTATNSIANVNHNLDDADAQLLRNGTTNEVTQAGARKPMVINLESSHVRNINHLRPSPAPLASQLGVGLSGMGIGGIGGGMGIGIGMAATGGAASARRNNGSKDGVKKKKNVFDLHLAKISMLPVGAESLVVAPTTLPFNPMTPATVATRSLLTQCEFERSFIKFRLRLVPPAGLCVLIDRGVHEIVIPFDEVEWFGIQECGGIEGGMLFEMGVVPGLGDGAFGGSGMMGRRRGGKSLRIRQPNKYLPASHDFTGGVIDQTRIIRMWVNPSVSKELAGGVGDMVIRELLHRDHQISPTRMNYLPPSSRSITPTNSNSSASASSASSSPRTSSLSDLPLASTNANGQQNKILLYLRQISKDKFRTLPQFSTMPPLVPVVATTKTVPIDHSPWNQDQNVNPNVQNADNFVSASEYTKREREREMKAAAAMSLGTFGNGTMLTLPLTPPLTPVSTGMEELTIGEDQFVMKGAGKDWEARMPEYKRTFSYVERLPQHVAQPFSNHHPVAARANSLSTMERRRNFDPFDPNTTPNPNRGFKGFASGAGAGEDKGKRIYSGFGVIGGERKTSSGSEGGAFNLKTTKTSDQKVVWNEQYLNSSPLSFVGTEFEENERFPLHLAFPNLTRNMSTSSAPTLSSSTAFPVSSNIGTRHVSLPTVGMTATPFMAAPKALDDGKIAKSMLGWIWNEDPLYDIRLSGVKVEELKSKKNIWESGRSGW
ncbi:hypothetical protein BT69DRAFT_149997 [Atractiella rhizophila]|nr:hypothetical protein BT69DRAFT_149997 [Atractiella rhizophila]